MASGQCIGDVEGYAWDNAGGSMDGILMNHAALETVFSKLKMELGLCPSHSVKLLQMSHSPFLTFRPAVADDFLRSPLR